MRGAIVRLTDRRSLNETHMEHGIGDSGCYGRVQYCKITNKIFRLDFVTKVRPGYGQHNFNFDFRLEVVLSNTETYSAKVARRYSLGMIYRSCCDGLWLQ